MSIKLAKQGVFWTIQGEGHYAGEPMIFVRLAGCSVGCPSCDTDYAFFAKVTVEDIVKECVLLRDENVRAKYVWITGGEPTDQDLSGLNAALWTASFKPCLATSGIRPVEGHWWWLSVSPHSNEFKQRMGAELKLVPGLNGLSLDNLDLSGTDFSYRYVQPMEGSKESLDACLEWVKTHNDYTFCSQSHKTWGVP
jgi:organic radical activating enzyme